MGIFNPVAHQSSMQELDLLNPSLDPRITYTGGPKSYVGSDGLLHISAANDWPLEYDPITLKPIGRSIWEQRTNLLLRSAEFDATSWTKDQLTVTPNAALAPDGLMAADLLVPSTTDTTSHRVYQDITAAAVAHAATIYAKPAGYAYLRLTNFSASATINLADGTIVASAGTPDAFRVTAAPLGYWRIEVVKTVAAGTVRTQFTIYNSAAQTSYSGDGVSGVYVWAAQQEAGAFASPYIPTAGSQVTRVADIADVAATDSKMRHNASGMTAYAEGICYDSNDSSAGSGGNGQNALIMLGDGLTDQAALRRNDSTVRVFRLYGYIRDAINPIAVLEGADNSYAPNVVTKAALALKPGNHAAASGGVVIGPDSSVAAVPSANLKLGRGYTTTIAPLNGVLRKVRFYPARLSATELQALTA